MIKSVKGFALGCYFVHDGNLFVVTQFPTRTSVCGELIHKFIEPCPQTVKTTIREVVELPELDWALNEAKEHRIKWLEQSGKR